MKRTFFNKFGVLVVVVSLVWSGGLRAAERTEVVLEDLVVFAEPPGINVLIMSPMPSPGQIAPELTGLQEELATLTELGAAAYEKPIQILRSRWDEESSTERRCLLELQLGYLSRSKAIVDWVGGWEPQRELNEPPSGKLKQVSPDFSNAIEWFSLAAQHCPESMSEALLPAASLMLDGNDFQGARRLYELYLIRTEGNGEALRRDGVALILADMERRQGRIEVALGLFQEIGRTALNEETRWIADFSALELRYLLGQDEGLLDACDRLLVRNSPAGLPDAKWEVSRRVGSLMTSGEQALTWAEAHPDWAEDALRVYAGRAFRERTRDSLAAAELVFARLELLTRSPERLGNYRALRILSLNQLARMLELTAEVRDRHEQNANNLIVDLEQLPPPVQAAAGEALKKSDDLLQLYSPSSPLSFVKDLQRLLRRALPSLCSCYETALRRHGDHPRGRVVLGLELAPDKEPRLYLVQSEMPEELTACIMGRFDGMVWPDPGAREISAKMPLFFQFD